MKQWVQHQVEYILCIQIIVRLEAFQKICQKD